LRLRNIGEPNEREGLRGKEGGVSVEPKRRHFHPSRPLQIHPSVQVTALLEEKKNLTEGVGTRGAGKAFITKLIFVCEGTFKF
jgi:hypothetical protein